MEGDICFEGSNAGVRLKFFTRKSGSNAELRPRTKYQKEWLNGHLEMLDAIGALSGDMVFRPKIWTRNPARTEQEAIDRVALLLEVASANDRRDLSDDALSLLASR